MCIYTMYLQLFRKVMNTYLRTLR